MGGVTPQRTKTEGSRRPWVSSEMRALECYNGLGDDRSVHKTRPAWEAVGAGGGFAEASSGWKTLMEREMGSSSKPNMGPRPAVLSLQ